MTATKAKSSNWGRAGLFLALLLSLASAHAVDFSYPGSGGSSTPVFAGTGAEDYQRSHTATNYTIDSFFISGNFGCGSTATCQYQYWHGHTTNAGGTTTAQDGGYNSLITCNPGYHFNGQLNSNAACIPGDPVCSVQSGTLKSLAGTGASPDTICATDHCNYKVNVAVDLVATNSWGGTYVSTGQVCTPPSSAPTPASSPAAETCKTVNGENVCTGGTTPNNCVKVNGNLSCTSGAGGVCTTSACQQLAQAVKNSDGSATAQAGTPTPPAPNAGRSGVPAQPSFSFVQHGDGSGSSSGSGVGQSSFYYYNSSVVNNSYFGDGSIGNRTTPSDAPVSCGGTGQPSCSTCGQPGQAACATCGGQGQPSCDTCGTSNTGECKVKVDEAGTPTNPPTGIKDPGEDAQSGLQAALGVSHPVSGFSWFDANPYNVGGCQQLHVDFHGSGSIGALVMPAGGFDIPGQVGCDKVEAIKSAAGWGMAVYTIWLIGMAATAAAGGGKTDV